MGLDEQKEEREVLDAIFPEEITGTREKFKLPRHLLKVDNVPCVGLAHSSLRCCPGLADRWLILFWVDISDTDYRVSILLDVVNKDGDDSEPRT
jgi:hypothetical protein